MPRNCLVNQISLSGLTTEGIYRVSGNKAEIESTQRQFEQGKFRRISVLQKWLWVIVLLVDLRGFKAHMAKYSVYVCRLTACESF